jgi:serine/threonine protein kinase
MAIQLEVIEGPDKGQVFTLPPSATAVIGRVRTAAVRLTDLHISREQCRIEPKAEGLVLTDAGSTGGTLVNGERVTRHILRVGDMIRVGETQLRVLEGDVADFPTLPPVPAVGNRLIPPVSPSPPEAIPVTPSAATSPAPLAEIAALPPERLGELTGQTFWHYQLGEPLARGQSGILFRGTDTRNQQPVAIKVLWPQLAQRDEEVQRIFRATRTMYTLRHPHIIGLHQAGKTGPYLWFAMDLIEGESLTQVIDRIGVAGMLDWRYALRVALHLGEALQFAHERHIVHRNITPQNVMIRSADKTALLGDLVLAKALEGALAQQITRPGEVLGDVRYMSPERLADVEPIDERSDIYSLGAMLYALLTGRPPFSGSSIIETIKLVQTAAPVPPKKYQMSVSDAFEGVVLKMLAKRPEERYQSAGDLLRDLQRVAKFHGSR